MKKYTKIKELSIRGIQQNMICVLERGEQSAKILLVNGKILLIETDVKHRASNVVDSICYGDKDLPRTTEDFDFDITLTLID